MYPLSYPGGIDFVVSRWFLQCYLMYDCTVSIVLCPLGFLASVVSSVLSLLRRHCVCSSLPVYAGNCLLPGLRTLLRYSSWMSTFYPTY